MGSSCDDEAVRGTASFASTSLVLLLVALLHAQGTSPPTPLTLVSRDGRRPLATTIVNGQELIALDDLAALFQIEVREDALAGGLTVTYRGQSVVMSPGQPMALVRGRVVALPAAPVRVGARWLVPLDFLSRALAPIHDTRIDLRRESRLVVVGDIRVPRVTARIDAAGPPTRATIEITPASPVTIATEPGRVVARIDADALDLASPIEGTGLIEAIRVGEQPRTVAVVLTSRAGAARAVPGETGGVTRITVEVVPAASETSAAPAPAVPPREAAPLPIPATRPPLQTIVLDPGHGGDDAGVRGAGGTAEKDITLAVARRVRALIETRLGVRVILTRDDDRPASLDERAAIANNSKADLFLSLHANAAPTTETSGAEVFHLRLDREGEDARRAAESEAVALPVLGGATRTIDVMRWDLAQVRHVDASAALAAMLEDQLRAQAPMGPQALRQAPLRVLTSVNMPAALVEMGYLTNGGQERQLASEAFQSSLAQGIYNAVLRFRAYLEEHRGL